MSVANSALSGSNDVSTFRAAEAYVRPSPIYTSGDLISHDFNLRQCTFSMNLLASRAADQDTPTEIYLPQFHFPQQEVEVQVSGGKWQIGTENTRGGPVQLLRWWHGDGEQKLSVKGIRRAQGRIIGPEEAEDSYLEQCRRNCVVM